MEAKADLLRQCKVALEAYYGPRLEGMVLYGSFARNQATESSDIDLLVVLRGPFNYVEELWHIISILYPVQLESAHLISAKPVPLEGYQQGALQLYRNAQRDGVPV